MKFLEKFQTRWKRISNRDEGYRLSCSNPTCSLSCANLIDGRLSVTSIHGTERHSYELTNLDMVFSTIQFLNSLSSKELGVFIKLFNEMRPKTVLKLETLE